MTKKEYEVLDRWADRYDVNYTPTESKVSIWDFTYERNDKKYYCEMKQRNFTLDYAMEKYTDATERFLPLSTQDVCLILLLYNTHFVMKR